MASSYGPFSLTVPDRSDAAKAPDNFRALVDSLSPYLGSDTGIASGDLTARPAATSANNNTLYVAKDGLNAGRTFLSNGSTWVELAVNLRLTRILAAAAADVPLRVTGASGQTANLIEVLNNAATTIFGVSSAGAVSATSVTSSGNVTGVGLVSSSAGVGLPNFATASLPATGPIGMLVYDTTVGQVKVKTASAAATYAAVGASSTLKSSGTYTGDGTTPRTITVGFTADLVIVLAGNNNYLGVITRADTNYRQALFVSGSSSAMQNDGQLVSNGFQVGLNTNYLNINSVTYAWSAYKIA